MCSSDLPLPTGLPSPTATCIEAGTTSRTTGWTASRWAPLAVMNTCVFVPVRPETVPSLELQYAELTEDPSSMILTPSTRLTVDQVFDKYMQALGGEARVSAITSFVATGTYSGFNTRSGDVPIEIASRAPNQRVQVVKMPDGDAIKTYDGQIGRAHV